MSHRDKGSNKERRRAIEQQVKAARLFSCLFCSKFLDVLFFFEYLTLLVLSGADFFLLFLSFSLPFPPPAALFQVKCLEDSRRFYRDLLGFSELVRPGALQERGIDGCW